ncbi:hypothetical protein FDP41_012399 [Naegleria fowleri]|uniref:Uncharacterized protein n=1 Tax=Naegleria fowleri TaxID=5763 RepID=A0A6A5C4N2_NAEFO|nr:uncharacterized protein FDP41_012399 [Naegleria fowleri]KAF0981742.1 hypothetical protein FDP41_012399 [Naegleria fowleri]CAG4717680.1 unnamed protein product [Naegleria fowleri]
MASSATLGPCLALAVCVGGIGAGPYFGRRLFEGKFREKQKPDYFRYGLWMRDYAVSDTIRENVEPTNGTIKSPVAKPLLGFIGPKIDTSNPFKAELEEQMDRLLLEVALKDAKK